MAGIGLTIRRSGRGSQMRRVCEPLTVGIPLRRGYCRCASALVLRDGTRRIPLQARVLDRWCDGSARWVLLDFQLTLPAELEMMQVTLTREGDTENVVASGIRVTDQESATAIDTGPCRFELSPFRFPFTALHAGTTDLVEAALPSLSLVVGGCRCELEFDAVTVEERGALRTAVLWTGSALRKGRRVLRLMARLHFFAGSPVVRFEVTVRNPRRARHRGGFWELGDPGSVLIDELVFACGVPSGASAVSYSEGPEMIVADAPHGVSVWQESSGGEYWCSAAHVGSDGRVPLRFRGYRVVLGERVKHGRRASPMLRVRSSAGELAVAMPHFWQQFPKSLSATPDGTIRLGLFPPGEPGPYELQGGEQKTHTWYAAFGHDGVTDTPLAWVLDPLAGGADPEVYCGALSSETLRPARADRDRRQREMLAAAVAGPSSFLAKREAADEFGWRDFGDLPADHESAGVAGHPRFVSHYNNQYDAVAGFARQFFRTGDHRWRELLVDLANHVIDIDLYHTAEDKAAYNGGLFWHTAHHVDAGRSTHRTYPRGPGHASGGPSAEHNYTTGLLYAYWLTGNNRAREAVLELAEWTIAMDDGDRTPFRALARGATGLASATASPGYHGPGRGAGNSINALLDAYLLTRAPQYLSKAEALIERCIHPRDDIERLQLLDAERRWSYTVFLQVLGRYVALCEDGTVRGKLYEYSREALRHYARWMADHERAYLDHPEQLEFPNETWAAQELRKSDVLWMAAGYASPEERARLLERSAWFHGRALATLSASEERTLTRPMVLLLSNGLPQSEGLLPPVREVDPAAIGFPAPQCFTPQKALALERAKLGMGGGLLASLVLLVWLFTR